MSAHYAELLAAIKAAPTDADLDRCVDAVKFHKSVGDLTREDVASLVGEGKARREVLAEARRVLARLAIPEEVTASTDTDDVPF